MSCMIYFTLAEFILERKRFFFYLFVACAFLFFEVKSVLPIDRYQNATSKAISQHELNKFNFKSDTRSWQDSIGHLKTLCMSVLSLVVALSLNENATAHRIRVEYEFSLMRK